MDISKITKIEKIEFYDDRSFYMRDESRRWYKMNDAFSNNYQEVKNKEEVQELENSYQNQKRLESNWK